MFEHLDLSELYDNDSKYGKEFIMGELTEERIRRAEENIGYRLSPAYIELLKYQNGGHIGLDNCWIETIYGIGAEEDSFNGLEEMFDNWIEEWEYPNIGIPFADTQSGGHDLYFMDYRNIGENDEPPIVHVDNEGDPDDVVIKHVADNLVEFIEMILEGQDIDGE